MGKKATEKRATEIGQWGNWAIAVDGLPFTDFMTRFYLLISWAKLEPKFYC